MGMSVNFYWLQKQLSKKLAIISRLVVSTHLKHISQIGSFPQVGMKIKKIETTR